jgi:thermostable 8-oxoguanine DNA glycosylase
MNITAAHLQQFQSVIDQYQHNTRFTSKDYWKDRSNNELWLWLVGQVMVVGGAASNDRFQSREDLKEQLNYNALIQYTNDKELQSIINEVLRAAGVRYASSDLEKCQKSKALVHNYRFISCYKGGFKGLLQDLAQMEGEQDRFAFLMQHLKFIKHKSARDFLMSMGINTHTLALDIRIQNIFRHFGIEFPTQAQLSSKAVYDSTEKEIIQKICKPLNMEPAAFDRILYQNYNEIIGRKGISTT